VYISSCKPVLKAKFYSRFVSDFGVGDVGSSVLGLSICNVGVVSLIETWVVVAGNMVVYEALRWSMVMRKGKRAFVPGLIPGALFPPCSLRKGEGAGEIGSTGGL
jgi:hypothetical protein